MERDPSITARRGRTGKGPLWENGSDGWENAPGYGGAPVPWWLWLIAPLIAAIPLAVSLLV